MTPCVMEICLPTTLDFFFFNETIIENINVLFHNDTAKRDTQQPIKKLTRLFRYIHLVTEIITYKIEKY
jgi:hypothetical protein